MRNEIVGFVYVCCGFVLGCIFCVIIDTTGKVQSSNYKQIASTGCPQVECYNNFCVMVSDIQDEVRYLTGESTNTYQQVQDIRVQLNEIQSTLREVKFELDKLNKKAGGF